MFTIFNLIELTAALGGGFFGIEYGNKHFGLVGAVMGGTICGFGGLICGRLPGVFSEWWIKHSIQHKPSAELRQNLQGEQYYLFHLFIATLMMREEDIQGELECILRLLRSEEFDKRRIGWVNLQFAYPESAAKISGYDPNATVEDCRNITNALADVT